MQPFQQRVVAERAELDQRIAMLGKFIDFNPVFDGLPEAERERLCAQFAVMRVYSDILGRRILAFDVSASKPIHGASSPMVAAPNHTG